MKAPTEPQTEEAGASEVHQVVATGRDPDAVMQAVGSAEQLLTTRLDVTDIDQAEAAAAAANERFGRIDVLINNAGLSYKGFFEEMSPAALEHELAVNLVGPMNVSRAVLPYMRRQRAGHLAAISSGAGLRGFAFSSVYAAAKAGLEGWMSALHDEVEPFGIHTTVVNPGFFRTDLISERSMSYAEGSIADYDGRREDQQQWGHRRRASSPETPRSSQLPSYAYATRTHHLDGSSPVGTPSTWLSGEHAPCSPRPRPTGNCRTPSRTTTRTDTSSR